jgi:hypothetical protein
VWAINNRDVTDEVEAWMETHAITWPWDRETQMLFVLTWG